jgi:hypothetical protein
MFLFATTCTLAVWPTQPSSQWVPGCLSLGLKQPGCDAHQSLPPTAKVMEVWSYTSTRPYVFMVGQRDNLIIIVIIITMTIILIMSRV